jgi:hypothetical protein
MRTITAEWLETAGACEGAVADFRRLFGESCEASARSARLWIGNFPNDHQDDLMWLAIRLMDPFDAETMEELEDRLAIEPELDWSFRDRVENAAWVLVQRLDDDRLAKAIGEIADRSTELGAMSLDRRLKGISWFRDADGIHRGEHRV